MPNLLLDGARALGVELDEAQARAFAVYRDDLLAWNEKFNLTAIRDPAEIVSKHFLDSLSALAPDLDRGLAALEPPPAHHSLMDIGSGAGFPGLPLKIARPGWRVTLLEATRKKCDFLEHIVAVLRLKDARVAWGRAETAGRAQSERAQYDWVTARAVTELNVLAEYMLPFARVGSLCIAWKGAGVAEEVRAAEGAIHQLGGRLVAVKPVTVPGIAQERYLVVIEKAAPTPDAYPRREGVAAKKPLR
ncbi:MAG: 16S rRNA (guanine(527)-N(7))-methyltransferase RsmG [Chloroflexi bacterium]|nr:16S rRNA (guanine(527)-N(7))-methyltransferase RsmG [Chloroflexota bacterium]